MWHTSKPIPTNLITGFLGTGKTTAIQQLLKHRPANERWSVLINEYGMVSIDNLMFDGETSDVQIQEIAGGCFCCTTAAMMDTVLMQLIRRTAPDRLLIEPSGAGHPARVIDVLRGSRFCLALDLRATICLVDPKDFENPRVTNTAGFYDQIQMSDVVAINFTDKRASAQTEKCRRWIDQFDPPKLLVAETQFGKLNPEWLDVEGTIIRPPRFPAAHDANHHHPWQTGEPFVSLTQSAASGRPLRLENSGNGQRACGWIFSPVDVFRRTELLRFLDLLNPVQRVKGLIHCDDDWWLFNRSGSEVSVTATAWRRDSRVEIITDDVTLNWSNLEADLLRFLQASQGCPATRRDWR